MRFTEDLNGLELTQYIRLVRKWAWLLLLFGFIAAGLTFVVSIRRPPVYQAQTTVSIGRYIEAPNPNSGDIRTGIDLAQTYAQIVTTFDVLQATIDALNLDMSTERLRAGISTRILTGTSLLVITVSYNDPVLAADLANMLAQQLIEQSPTNLTDDQESQVDFLNSQIEDLTTQVEQSRIELEELNTQIQQETDPIALESLRTQRNSTTDQLNVAQGTIAQFTETIASLQERTNALDIVEQARIPTTQSGSRIEISVLIGALVGVVLAFGVVLLIEYLDDVIRTTEDATTSLMLPVMGAIVRFGKRSDKYDEMLLTNYPSLSPIVESYRTTRTNMLFSSGQKANNVFMVSSANPQEGKTVTICNLAVIMAQAGLQVLLIDADLRRPKVHDVFKLDNDIGLTTLLFSDPTSTEDGKLPESFYQCVKQTSTPKLRVITSGFIPSNPAEILGSEVMGHWIDTFRASSEIDIVLIDAPPALAATDGVLLAAKTKADVLLVVDCGKTRHGAAAKAKEQFTKLGIELRGVIVNRVNPRDEEYSYYGYYYSQTATRLAPSANAKNPDTSTPEL
jgi:capsular exopolysaccharide synthesis family protein